MSERDDGLIREWRQQASILMAASKDDGTSSEQRDLMIGTAKGLRYCAKKLKKFRDLQRRVGQLESERR